MSISENHPSCIPRLSRLPRPTVTIPKPGSTTTPVGSPALRLTPSRDSLNGRITPGLPSPSLRSSLSRNFVHSCSGHASPHEAKSFVRHCASREQMRPSVTKVSTPKSAVPRSTPNASASRRWSTITQHPTTQYSPWAEPRPGDPDRDDYIRASTPIDDAPKLLLTSYLNGTLGNSRMSDHSEPPSASSDSVFSERIAPSLSDRTMETLSQVPSSPDGSRKSFGESRRDSMADRNASSRPGSDYNSENSSGLISPTVFKSQIPIGRASFAPTRLPYAASIASDVPSPAPAPAPVPVKRLCGSVHGRTCSSSRPVAGTKSAKPKINRLARNLSISTLGSESEFSGPPSAGWDGSVRPTLSHLPKDADEPAFRKSSSTLREHIAKAKAARRAAMQKAGGDETSSVGNETSAAQSIATGFDESAYDDPFGLNKGGNKVLKQRVSAARTSGRLNIAALALKEIPSEVMKMYDLESIQESGGTWADSVDLKRFIASDNELEKLEDAVFPDCDLESSVEDGDEGAASNIFAVVESIDLHGNQLVSVPVGLRRLSHLTSLNLSSNRLDNECLGVITQIASLRDLKLANNSLAGPLEVRLANLNLLETLDIHGNHVSSLPSEVQSLTRLRILNMSENNFESIDFNSLVKLPLIELDLKRNKLSGTLIEDSIESLPHLQTFNVSSNRLTRLVPEGASIGLPVLHTLLLSMNRLQELPDMSSWTNLLTLTANTNNIAEIPASFPRLLKLGQADFTGNNIKVIPPEIARMEDLTILRLGGNPLREKKFASASVDVIKSILAGRLEPPPSSPEVADTVGKTVATESAKVAEECKSDEEEKFSTAPTSALQSPSRAGDDSSLELTWEVKSGGLLDQSRSALAILDSEICIKVRAQYKVHHLHLHHNLLTCMPGALSSFAVMLTSLALGHNKMEGETYLMEELTLPSLSELNLESNKITSLGPLTKFLRAPSLEKIDVSKNRLIALPLDLKDIFPKMIALLAANNHLTELNPVSIRGLRVVDVSHNEIAHLDPRIGLLGDQFGLQKPEILGNRFRVPRWDVLEQGTEATLSWLRGRVSAADLAAWKAEHGGENGDVEDDLD